MLRGKSLHKRLSMLDGGEVWTKKYFYVLRPILACIWIEQGHGVERGALNVAQQILIGRKTL